MNKNHLLIFTLFAVLIAVPSATAQTGSYWIEKPVWQDLPVYAREINIEYSPTGLIQERITETECKEYVNQSTENGTTTVCDSYRNYSIPGPPAPIFDIESGETSYLGNGHIRTDLSIGLNEISAQTLKENTFLMTEAEYINWFNQNYYYNGTDITGPDIDDLQERIERMSAEGGNTNILGSRLNSFEITSLSPFRAEAGVTSVFRLKNFRSGSFIISDIVKVKVQTSDSRSNKVK